MELCNGDLKNAIENKNKHTPEININNMTFNDFLIILLSNCWGLKLLHDSKLIHTDLAPDNIFLMNNVMLSKIGDLGCTIICFK